MSLDLYLTALVEFSEKFGHHMEFSPKVPPQEIQSLRSRLITEEYNELDDALMDKDLDRIAKELSDLLYVVFGTAVAYGIPIHRVFQEVHRSNMTKSQKKEVGKTVKGSDYRPPDVHKILWGGRS